MERLNAEYDVVIIGSGPAGIAAALYGSRNGLKVVVITKDQSNKIKHSDLRVESFEHRVIMLLGTLGIDRPQIDLGTYKSISNGKEKKEVLGIDGGRGYHVNRAIFLAWLRDQAKAKGVSLIENETVHSFLKINNRVVGVRTENGAAILSRYVIDASGKSKLSKTKLNLLEQYYSPKLVAYSGTCIGGDMSKFESDAAIFLADQHGWCWIAQLTGRHFAWTRLVLQKDVSLCRPKVLEVARDVTKIVCSQVRWRLARPLCMEGLVLCGEAACVIDPAAGQGIFFALSSGIHAMNTVIKCISSMENETLFLANYDYCLVEYFERQVMLLKSLYEAEKFSW